MKLDCYLMDVCLPDYFQGETRAHIQIPVYHGMSLRQIKIDLLDELKQGYVNGTNDLAWLLSADYVGPDRAKDAEKVFKAAMAAINRMKPEKKGQRAFFKDLEKNLDEDCDSVYAYFVFIEI